MKHFIFPGVFRDRDRHNKALQLSLTAIRLDPKGVNGHRATAYSYALLDQFELAEHHFRLVLELNENDVWGQVSASAGIGLCGKWQEAAQKLEHAMSLTRHPTSEMISYHAYNCFALQDHAAVVKSAPHMVDVTFARAISIAARVLSGDAVTARQEYAKLYLGLRRTWASNGPSDDVDITNWLVQMSAVSSEEVRARLRHGLERAAEAPPDVEP
jgi:Tfp pilus assembly protein PilF